MNMAYSDTLEDFPRVASGLEPIRDKLLLGERLGFQDGVTLFQSQDIHALGAMAQWCAQKKHRNEVFYVLNGHINYSNYCTLSCPFCSFFRRKGKDRRPDGYEMNLEEVMQQADAIASSGATEIHIVGGLHPDFPFSYYTGMLKGIRSRHPKIGLKCFTAIEIYHLSALAKLSPIETLQALKEAGLDALPGGGAEVLVDEVRQKICIEKESSSEWLELHRQAHHLGIPTNATLLYGHVESIQDRVEHLMKLRDLQDETSGFLAFIPLSYHPDNNFLKIEHGPGGFDELRTYAVSRMLLDNFPHIKAYWVMLSVPIAQVALAYGASDFDGTVLQEKIYHMAGAQSPQSLSVENLQFLIREAGRMPLERDLLYRRVVRGCKGPLDWTVLKTL